MKKILFIISVIFVLSGCQTEAKFKKNMNSWVGKDIGDLVDLWGYPDNERYLKNGNTVYIYSSGGTFITPSNTTYNTRGNVYGNNYYSTTTATTTGGFPITFNCTVSIEFNKKDIIRKVRWKGNNCVSY
ncbi:membrane lipoprotein lipid attachment site-containing protein [Proteus mirabilis]|uniref:membrane lipoprotein lipid attachment site-containing protein n=2 Tax=Morganellaceae TaxID=1903414 RepID=UPI000D578F36|nr:membrane lipoprotein lipid attachment site-containing protein [Proteus mirabilis]EIT1737302.1 membrane lipoprotein lipid attachment site-containing protein [Proteus mirabilis]ELA9705517.1 membrane lipoprotein lipid attachment site-containing protein [Proteus mirabilis]ELI8899722.1 membrane lipoprotein lipid attachment site-containing protein [Proteus mirabilis]MBG2750181.1 membrane lipoprotein lipid attachment site-containing protein [Proteus mirabilis]MBG3033730.1 membrane lipoprotein lipi